MSRILVTLSMMTCAAIFSLTTGCQTSASLRMYSLSHPGQSVSPQWKTVISRIADDNTVDVYLSDIEAWRLVDHSHSLENESGQIVHVHMFLSPHAGRTPIASTACNATIRHMIFTPTAAGEYGGGLFIMPAVSAGRSQFQGTITDGRLKLLHQSGEFIDRLGAAGVRGSLRAAHDPLTVRRIELRLDMLRRQRFGQTAAARNAPTQNDDR
ncbi:MAG: hypothetical protein KAS72_04080 [Phycisphaerales bacterium]|nr:hypothetical protein [Phycisphaerales bacterium]